MTLKYIDIMEKDIYIEYTNNEFEYISFTKAKKLILESKLNTIKFNIVDKEKSINFLNSLLSKYIIIENNLRLK